MDADEIACIVLQEQTQKRHEAQDKAMAAGGEN